MRRRAGHERSRDNLRQPAITYLVESCLYNSCEEDEPGSMSRKGMPIDGINDLTSGNRNHELHLSPC
jgi:hypothetical protein